MRRILFLALALVILLSAVALAQETAYQKGVSAYLSKDYKAAVEHLKEYVAERPEAGAYYIMGYAVYALERQGQKDFGESAHYFRQAYLINPEFDPESIGFAVK